MKEFTCIVCPRGCLLRVEKNSSGEIKVEGNSCVRGAKYAVSEITNPVRNVTFNIRVRGGDRKVIGVKTSSPVSVETILKMAEEIKKMSVEAPVKRGEEVLKGRFPVGLKAIEEVKEL